MKKRQLAMLVLLAALVLPTKLWAQEAYAVLSDDSLTVTFYYDDQKASRSGVVEINTTWFNPSYETSAYGYATQAVFDPSFADYRPTSTSYWFMNCSSLTAIGGMENLNTENVTDMHYMFDGCSGLTTLDVSNFNTENVTDMSCMFYGCSGLTTLDVSNFNTENVTDMHYMFDGCSGLTTLDVSNFNTENVTYMNSMFGGCSGLTTLDVSNFNTANVTSMESMFYVCSDLTILDVSNFNTANVTYMGSMFDGCSGLTNLDLSNFNTSNVRSMGYMFSDCSGLTTLDVSNFNTANVTGMSNMFSGCSGLTTLDVSNFNTENVTYMNSMFSGCSGLTTLDVSNFNTANVTDMKWMFIGCSGLTALDVSNFNTENVTYMGSMFSNCSGLTTLDVSNFNTVNVTDMSDMFYGCSGLTSLDVSNFNTANVTGMLSMFEGCSSLTSLDVSNFNTENVTDMEWMFSRCTDLVTIYAGNSWSTANVTESFFMFDYCTSLVGGAGTAYDEHHIDASYAHIDGGADNPGYFTAAGAEPYVLTEAEAYAVLTGDTISGQTVTFYYDTQKASRNGVVEISWTDTSAYSTATSAVIDPSFADYRPTSTAYWFIRCSSLTAITGMEFLNTEAVTDMRYMFGGCSSLTSLDISNFNTANVTDMSLMFSGCSGLATLDVSNFNTSNVTNMYWMFSGCTSLTTIFVNNNWSVGKVDSERGSSMFTGCTSLVGGYGTTYNATHVDYTYAHIDGGTQNPGYFTPLNGYGEAARPTFTHEGNKVFINSSTEGATIYYVIGTNTPDSTSTVYADSVVVTQNCIIRAIAMRQNFTPSSVATYVVDWFKVAPVQFTQDGTKVSMYTETEQAIVHYTLLDYDLGDIVYQGTPVTMPGDAVIEAWAVRDGYTTSDTTRFEFHASGVTVSNPVFAQDGNVITITTATEQAAIYYTTDGAVPDSASLRYTAPFEVDRNMTLRAIALRQGYFPSQVTDYAVDWFRVSSVEFAQNGYVIALSTATEQAEIHYTLSNNSEAGEQVYTEPLTMTGDCLIEAWAVRDGYTTSDTTRFEFRAADVTAATPVIVQDGNVITISTATEQATIFYTLDGSKPTRESTAYSGELVLMHNCRVRAIAVMENMYDSEEGLLEVVGLTKGFGLPRPVIGHDDSIVSIAVPALTEATDVTDKVQTEPAAWGGAAPVVSLAGEWTCSVLDDGGNVTGTLGVTLEEGGNAVFPSPCMEGSWTYNPNGALDMLHYKYLTQEGAYSYDEYTLTTETPENPIEFSGKRYSTVGNWITESNSVRSVRLSYNGESLAMATISTADGRQATAAIADEGSSENTGDLLQQSITGLDNGYYSIELYAKSVCSSAQPMADDITYIYANEVKLFIPVEADREIHEHNVYQIGVEVTDGTLRLGLGKDKAGANWHAVQIKSLAYHALDMARPMEDAIIYYTLDGTRPDSTSTAYVGSFEVERNVTIKAIALRTNYYPSQVDSLVVDWFRVADVEFAQDGNVITLSTATEQAEIHYILSNDSEADEQVYTEPLALTGDCLIAAWAVRDGYTTSDTTRFEFYFTPLGLAEFDGRVATVSGERMLDEAFEQAGGRTEAAKTITAIVWQNATALTDDMLEGITNPNLLIYVASDAQAQVTGRNVIVDGTVGEITLTDTGSGNCDFYCPQAFTAGRISYTRNFRQQTQVGVSRGWETLALPFTVQHVTHETKGAIVPFGDSDDYQHFWLRRLTADGLQRATQVEANVPYIISMPNDRESYLDAACLNGRVTFWSEDVTVPVTEQVVTALADSTITMHPALQRTGRSSDVWALNVGEVRGQYLEGSVFERDYREVRPFEAYTVHRGGSDDDDNPTPRFVPIASLPDGTTGIEAVQLSEGCDSIATTETWYDLQGRKIKNAQGTDGKAAAKGLYIVNGRKRVVK